MICFLVVKLFCRMFIASKRFIHFVLLIYSVYERIMSRWCGALHLTAGAYMCGLTHCPKLSKGETCDLI